MIKKLKNKNMISSGSFKVESKILEKKEHNLQIKSNQSLNIPSQIKIPLFVEKKKLSIHPNLFMDQLNLHFKFLLANQLSLQNHTC